MSPREPEKIGQIFKDEDGKPLEGQKVLKQPDEDSTTGFIDTFYSFKNGKIHGTPAIEYPDGQEEDWDNGSFVKIALPPLMER